MQTATDRFEEFARVLADRVAEGVSAGVAVVDDRGVVVARGGEPGAAWPDGDGYLRVPFRLEDRAGEIVVAEPAGEKLPPRAGRLLVELIVDRVGGVERLPNQHELKNKFIHDLLHGPVASEGALLREAQILGMDLTPPRAVILIDAAAYILPAPGSRLADRTDARIRRRAKAVIASVVSFFNLPNDTICAYIGDGEVAVLKASTTQDLVAWTDDGNGSPAPASPSWANLDALKRASAALLQRLRRDTGATINIGIGRYHPGLPGLPASYQDARAALSLGRRVGGHNRVHCLDSLGIAAFVGLADERTKLDLATHLLSPLDHEPELIETVAAFFREDCCVSTTATRLAIHRNTLSYRLDKIASLTGLDSRRFDEAVQIRLALLLRSLRIGQS